ncbi:MAG TPA: ATP-dependent helicase [Candidatus Limnocylindrales bacterium]
MSHPSVVERLARLAPDQREAATAPPGPVLCVAPAGSGKTTTLVARVAWLVDGGTSPASITALTFNRRAAEELSARLEAALQPLGVPADAVRVRTFHALGREILAGDGVDVGRLVDRAELLRDLDPAIGNATIARLDTAFSRLKLDLRVDPARAATDATAGPVVRTWVAYEQALAERRALDFDDLVRRSLERLETSPAVRSRWRAACAHLLVDEAQDLDRSQLDLALILAAPENRIFLVGDDDQSIYGWRLADVRRVLGLAAALPGLRRVDLVTNYRCPRPVVERAVRLVEVNRERFLKRIVAGPASKGRLVLAPDGNDDDLRVRRAMATWPADGSTRAVLARTNAELRPAVAAALSLGVPFRAPGVELLVESPLVEPLLDSIQDDDRPLLVRVDDAVDRSTPVGAAVLGWAAAYRDLGILRDAVRNARTRLASLRRDDAELTIATAHGTKGLEWDHVVVLGMDAGRFPSRRAVESAPEPHRALEEERRLAYVAWTRARVSLTLLYDPAAPSSFLLEAFTAGELALDRDAAAETRSA